MFLESKTGLPPVEERYQLGLNTMLFLIASLSPDVVFYPGDSAIRMAHDLETQAKSLGRRLPKAVKVPHDLNRSLYVPNPYDSVGRLLRLVHRGQNVFFADDCAEFGDKLAYYDQLFQFAGISDLQMVVLAAGDRYKYRDRENDVPFRVLLYDQDLFAYLSGRNLT